MLVLIPGGQELFKSDSLPLEGGRRFLPYRILVAENEFLIRWSLTQALAREGYEVTAVANGHEAIETGRTTHFDFVITDLFMPEANGWDVLAFFSQTQPLSRVIIITAHGGPDTGRMAGERGAWGYVEKPYVIDQVKGMLRSLAAPLR